MRDDLLLRGHGTDHALGRDDAPDALDGLSRHVALAHDLLATGA